MLLFVYNNFQIDLTHLKVTFNEKNPWLQEELSSEYSFPFTMSSKDWVKQNDFTNYNTAGLQTEFVGKLYRDGELFDATLKIQNQQGDTITGIIYAGLDGLRVLDFSLNEIPLDSFPVENIKLHAEETIKKDYPEVSHNFPMIHTDKYDPESQEFNNFEGIINNYFDGHFIDNVLQLESNLDDIKNLMQPLPYLMHVVKKGFEHSGLQLEGDILNDPDFKQALIFRDGEYFNSLKKDSIPLRVNVDEWVEELFPLNNIPHVRYTKSVTIEKKGDYLIFGDIFSIRYMGQTGPSVSAASNLLLRMQKFVNGVPETLFQYIIEGEEHDTVINNSMLSKTIDLSVSLSPGDVITFTKIEPKRDDVPSVTPDYPEAASLEIIPIRYRNPDGSPILSLLDLEEVDLTRVVPDMKFIDLMGILRKWKNFGFTLTGNVVRMDYISPMLNVSAAADLRSFEIEEPLRDFLDERSFELSFTDGKAHETYKYDSILVDRKGVVLNEYKKDDNATAIPIDALYYPVVEKNGIVTAHAFDDETSKLRLVFFRKMPEEGRPICYDNQNLSIPNIYNSNYKKWLDFRVNSVSYQWDFVIPVEKFKDIQLQKLLYVFKNYHVFTELEKERIMPHYWRVTAKSESLQ